MVHICDAPIQLLTDAGLSRPDIFCGLRNVLEVFGATMSTPDVALQLIVPSMFIFMAARFLMRGIAASIAFASNRLPEAAEGEG
jgi:hypothetical protein